MLAGMASEISKKHTYKCVACSRHNELKSYCTHLVMASSIPLSWIYDLHTLMFFFLLISLAIPTNKTFRKCFWILVHLLFWLIQVCVFSGWRYSSISKATAQLEKAAAGLVTVWWNLVNQEPWYPFLNVCKFCVYVCVCGGGGVIGLGGGYLMLPSPLIGESHEL